MVEGGEACEHVLGKFGVLGFSCGSHVGLKDFGVAEIWEVGFVLVKSVLGEIVEFLCSDNVI